MTSAPDNNNTGISRAALKNLNIARKWAMFLAVLGFIFFGLIVIIGFITGTFLSVFRSDEINLGMPDYLAAIFYSSGSIIYFFVVYFLYRFSKAARDAIQKNDSIKLNKAFRYLKIFFTFTGILVMIVLAAYITTLILAGVSLTLPDGV